ncbi:F-box protein At-B [Solanum lycopersicum]|uniref:Uncharacterized protein n=1 Tax=Solanum lycopersicum TaxID=4081 RepID=Q9AR34_SOLLC|nr:F-box protein At-B [Solanum lycopersicum]CAC36396.1 hypothetical protein [Solanum lycopersicum]CAC36400.1 hypothetical protein [Solanum lycopersicum]
MAGTAKRHHTGEEGGAGSSDDVFEPSIDKFPVDVISCILEKLDLESVCSAACVSQTLSSAAAQVFTSLSSLDLSGHYLDEETLEQVARRVQGAKSLTIDCLQLKNGTSIFNILGEHIEELSLLKCSRVSYHILSAIRERCPNLRSLLIEFAGSEDPQLFENKLAEMLQKLTLLEVLSIKIRGTYFDVFDIRPLELFLPKSLRKLKLQQTEGDKFVHWLEKIRDIPWFNLQSLSLVLDVISDSLLRTVVNSLPLLVELDLEDRPFMDPTIEDLTNVGLQRVQSCKHLITLAIVRSSMNYRTAFRRVNNMGMFLLSEGCGRLESVKLGGFANVTDAGFSTILNSCRKLKKLEVLNSCLLSDLAFHNMRGVARSLIELRLLSCRLLTSEALEGLSLLSKLEVLDTSGCRSIGNPCLFVISRVTTLTKLNLAEADITDKGLALLGMGNLGITQLCIRGCKRVTDKGIERLFCAEGKIGKTLSLLDVSRMPGITDAAIFTIASAAKALTDLSLRYCFHVTDAGVKMLLDRPNHKVSLLQKLDLYKCRGLSGDWIMSSFCGLRWLGVGGTLLVNKRDDFSTICNVRPWLVVCFDGCEFGCHDGWQFHRIIIHH